jgi:hypothetical protein
MKKIEVAISYVEKGTLGETRFPNSVGKVHSIYIRLPKHKKWQRIYGIDGTATARKYVLPANVKKIG